MQQEILGTFKYWQHYSETPIMGSKCCGSIVAARIVLTNSRGKIAKNTAVLYADEVILTV